MADIKSEYFSDSEIAGLLEDIGDEGGQTVADFLLTLFSLYEISADGEAVSEVFTKDWQIFTDEDALASVLSALGNPFGLTDRIRYVEEYRNYIQSWTDVKEDVKTNFRFFCHMDSIRDILEDYDINNDALMLFKDTKFFRARVHHKVEPAFTVDEMGCPPTPQLATPGRANPNGIRYLYLCGDDETPFYEVRPYYLDRVDIGEFVITEDNIKIVDFTEKVNLFNVFNDEGEDSFKEKVKRRVLFDSISRDLSKPLRSFDTELEYVPTQYVCEYFKNIGADGIMFASSVHKEGKNLVLFQPDKARCIAVRPYEVNGIAVERKLV